MLGMRSRATLYLALIFLCGVGSGVVGTRLMNRTSVSADTQQTATRSPGTSSKVKGAVRSFTKHLDLTPAQVQKLTVILEETRTEYKEHELQIESIRQHGNVRIREILDPEQKVKFDELLARRAEKDRRKNDQQQSDNQSSSR